MTELVQLIGRRESGRPAADDGNTMSGPFLDMTWLDPTFLEGAVDNRPLNRFDGDRVFADTERTRSFTRRRTDTTRELREVIRLHQPFIGSIPVLICHELVPLRNQIVNRATDRLLSNHIPDVTERGAAIHAALGLFDDRSVFHP